MGERLEEKVVMRRLREEETMDLYLKWYRFGWRVTPKRQGATVGCKLYAKSEPHPMKIAKSFRRSNSYSYSRTNACDALESV